MSRFEPDPAENALFSGPDLQWKSWSARLNAMIEVRGGGRSCMANSEMTRAVWS
ncbi:hypothetical protein YT1_3954 [Rhodococcus ruber]|nr:hypothetical protein YT1_3954 [Rhodococcus ruber]